MSNVCYNIIVTREELSMLEQLEDYLRYFGKFKDLDKYDECELSEDEIVRRSLDDFGSFLKKIQKEKEGC